MSAMDVDEILEHQLNANMLSMPYDVYFELKALERENTKLRELVYDMLQDEERGHNVDLTFEEHVKRANELGVELETSPITCKDCKHSHMTDDGKLCKWCSIMATHEIDSDGYVDYPHGYDPEPYFEADFFCGYAERRGA